MKRTLLATLPAALALASGCARPPRPPVMAEADAVRQTSGAQTAASLAPEAFGHAEKLRKDAESAYEAGDLAGAQILAERAVAAYQHALVLARIARATEAANRARLSLRTSEQSLAQSEGEQRRISAQADDLELRIKVIKDANPIVATGPADGVRELARLGAARSLALDARLLCAAARMIAPETPTLASAQQATDELDKKLSTQPRPAPIESAMRARAQCLAALTAARRPAGTTSSLGKSDQLLSELSAVGGLSPVRDDRGVVVTLRKIFSANQLSKEGREQVEALGKVALAHAEFPLQVVVHAAGSGGSGKDSTAPDRQRGEAVAKVLSSVGTPSERILVEAAGTAHPAIDPVIAHDPARNDRIEIIFVDPGG